MEKTVLVVLPLQAHHRALLEESAPGYAFTYAAKEAVTAEMVKQADVIIGNVPAQWLRASPRLAWLQLDSAGADAYIAPGILAEHTVLTCATGAYGKAVAEHLFAMLWMLQKKLHLYRDHQNRHEWTDEGPVTSVAGKTVLVVGLGTIGLYFARLVKAVGAHVIGVKRRPTEQLPDCADAVYQMDRLQSLLPQADVVASVLPGTQQTRRIFGASAFAAMKPEAFFLNAGRGINVDTDALCSALKSRQIAGAGIDVTDPEPLPAGHALWSCPNALITPHISGQFHLQDTLEQIVQIAAENLRRFANGLELKSVVDFESGYSR